jgi:hypothetical protein
MPSTSRRAATAWEVESSDQFRRCFDKCIAVWMWNHVQSRLQEGNQHIIAHTCVRFFTNMNAYPMHHPNFLQLPAGRRWTMSWEKPHHLNPTLKLFFENFKLLILKVPKTSRCRQCYILPVCKFSNQIGLCLSLYKNDYISQNEKIKISVHQW